MNRAPLSYFLALSLVGLACLLRWSLPPVLGPTPYLAFYPAVVAAAALGGLGPGLLATVASSLCVDLIFDATPARIILSDPITLGRMAVFFAGGIGISVVSHVRRAVQIRERRQAAELAESEGRFRGTFENAAVGIAHLDAEGRFLRVNERLREILGYYCEELRGMNFRDLTDPGTAAQDLAQYPKLMRGELATYTVEKRYLRRDGRPMWVSVTRSLQRDQEGQPAYSIAIVQDTTDRKKVEEDLRESEQRFRGTFENAALGIVEVDQEDRFIAVNHRVCQMLGYRREELLGKSVHEITHPDDHVQSDRLNAELHEGHHDLFDYEKRYLKYDGTPLWVHVSVSAVRDQDGRFLRAIGTIEDISQRKQAEQQLKELNETLERQVVERTTQLQQRAEQLRRLATELTQAEQRERKRIAMVLHDHLQQLLVGSKLHVNMLLQEVMSKPEATELCQRVDDLLNQSLEASRSLTAELSPTVLFRETFAGALRWLGQWMHEKHGLIVCVDAEESADLQPDDMRVLLFQAVRELLFNIVKHAKTDSAAIQMSRRNGQVQVTVSDRGAGFDPSGYRGESKTTGGFGLFAVQERLELVGGRMDVASRPGQGTRVTLWAPAHPARQEAPSVEPSAPLAEEPGPAIRPSDIRETTETIRILLADDHAVVRDGLARLLHTQPGMKVIGQASDGKEAVQMALELWPEIILMDVSMPHVDGLEATRQIKRSLPHVKIIGLSMHGEDEMASHMKAAGACAYLTKTAAPHTLIEAIQACVGKKPGTASASNAA